MATITFLTENDLILLTFNLIISDSNTIKKPFFLLAYFNLFILYNLAKCDKEIKISFPQN